MSPVAGRWFVRARKKGGLNPLFRCRCDPSPSGAPKYAGQPSGHVTLLPGKEDDDFDPEEQPFSVFVMRVDGASTLGWEYCGEYLLLNDLKGAREQRPLVFRLPWAARDLTFSSRQRQERRWRIAYRTPTKNSSSMTYISR